MAFLYICGVGKIGDKPEPGFVRGHGIGKEKSPCIPGSILAEEPNDRKGIAEHCNVQTRQSGKGTSCPGLICQHTGYDAQSVKRLLSVDSSN